MLIYEESMKIKVSTPKNSAYCYSVEIKVTAGQYWQISNLGTAFTCREGLTIGI